VIIATQRLGIEKYDTQLKTIHEKVQKMYDQLNQNIIALKTKLNEQQQALDNYFKTGKQN